MPECKPRSKHQPPSVNTSAEVLLETTDSVVYHTQYTTENHHKSTVLKTRANEAACWALLCMTETWEGRYLEFNGGAIFQEHLESVHAVHCSRQHERLERPSTRLLHRYSGITHLL